MKARSLVAMLRFLRRRHGASKPWFDLVRRA